jgi:hypothetical protein
MLLSSSSSKYLRHSVIATRYCIPEGVARTFGYTTFVPVVDVARRNHCCFVRSEPAFCNPPQHQQRSLQPTNVRFSSSDVVSLKDSYEYIKVDVTSHPGVGVITLHRPKALNALCDDLFVDLIHATTALDHNDTIGCLILTGSTKAFAAGADISEMKDRTFDYAYTKVCCIMLWFALSLLVNQSTIEPQLVFCYRFFKYKEYVS